MQHSFKSMAVVRRPDAMSIPSSALQQGPAQQRRRQPGEAAGAVPEEPSNRSVSPSVEQSPEQAPSAPQQFLQQRKTVPQAQRDAAMAARRAELAEEQQKRTKDFVDSMWQSLE